MNENDKLSENNKRARSKAGLWVSLLAYAAGFAWLYSVSTPEITGNFSEREMRNFRVLGIKAGAASGPPEYLTLTLAKVSQRGPDLSQVTFLLPQKAAQVSGGDLHKATVLESNPDWQLIQYDYANTHSSVSRYRAFKDRVEPVSYRVTSDPGLVIGAIILLVPAWITGVVAGWIAKRF